MLSSTYNEICSVLVFLPRLLPTIASWYCFSPFLGYVTFGETNRISGVAVAATVGTGDACGAVAAGAVGTGDDGGAAAGPAGADPSGGFGVAVGTGAAVGAGVVVGSGGCASTAVRNKAKAAVASSVMRPGKLSMRYINNPLTYSAVWISAARAIFPAVLARRGK